MRRVPTRISQSFRDLSNGGSQWREGNFHRDDVFDSQRFTLLGEFSFVYIGYMIQHVCLVELRGSEGSYQMSELL